MVEGDAGERTELSEAETEAYKARREALNAGVADLDEELDALEAQPEPDAERFAAAVRGLLGTVRQHVDEAEASDGLLARILEEASWLASRVERLRREHDQLLERTQDLLQRAEAGGDLRPLLAEARELSTAVSEHRHRGTDLLMDAYMLDVSAGD